MRSLRRVVALDALFERGLYVEAHAVVRAGYEDWITFSYILNRAEHRWRDFQADVHKVDARVYDAFRRLCGDEEADQHFKNMPPEVRQHVGKTRRTTRVLGGITMAARAAEVGLSLVHAYVYEWLSAYSHPTTRAYKSLFEQTPSGVSKVRNLRRDDKEEADLGLWAWWFELRILTLAGAQYGIDVESLSDELIALRDLGTLHTCALVRESIR